MTAQVGIAGAGLLGRLLAWRLARGGVRVAVFDAAPGPQAGRVADGVAQGDPGLPHRAAAFSAAGMLSPTAELENAGPRVAALGWRSLPLWQRIAGSLQAGPFVRVRGSLLVAHRPDLGAARRVLSRLDATGVRALDGAALQALEPGVRAAHAWLLDGEGQLDPPQMLAALHDEAAGVQWHWSAPVAAVDPGTIRLADGRVQRFECVFDVRGVGAKPQLPVRGVRGEIVWLHAPGHGLQRPVRLLHPRHRVYVVPRPDERIVIGATEIESEDRSPVSLRSAVELMSAAHSIVPALAEARIVAFDSNLRPALPDNEPFVEAGAGLVRINGLFRHGWLLAPALVDDALAQAGLAAPWSGRLAACDDPETVHPMETLR